MNKDHALGGLVIGLLGGAVLGAFIFSISGSLDLGFGMLLILIVALASAALGWFVGPVIMNWSEKQKKPLTERKEYKRIIDQTLDENINKPDADKIPRSFQVDFIRLGGLSLFFFVLGVFFAFLTWYQGISYWAFVIFFAFLTLFNLVKILRNASKSIEINANGIEYKSQGKNRFIEWKEVDYIWEKQEKVQFGLFPIKHEHNVILDLRDGDSIKLDRNLKDFINLANLLHEGVTRYQFPIAVRGLEQGRTIDFIILELNNDGIIYKNKRISWQEIDQILMNHARVMIQRTGKNWVSWADIKGWDLPNLRLFALIANEYTKVV